MELGNLLFGHSHGNYAVPREDPWEQCFVTLLKFIDGPNYDGYGTEFVCEDFEIHRYYWGDCICGFEAAETEWHNANPHSEECQYNRITFCHCGTHTAYITWLTTHNHKQDCPIIRPNFAYAPLGFALSWYKYPFRDAYMSHPVTFEEFRNIINKCLAWLQQHPHARPQRTQISRTHTRRLSIHTAR